MSCAICQSRKSTTNCTAWIKRKHNYQNMGQCSPSTSTTCLRSRSIYTYSVTISYKFYKFIITVYINEHMVCIPMYVIRTTHIHIPSPDCEVPLWLSPSNMHQLTLTLKWTLNMDFRSMLLLLRYSSVLNSHKVWNNTRKDYINN